MGPAGPAGPPGVPGPQGIPGPQGQQGWAPEPVTPARPVAEWTAPSAPRASVPRRPAPPGGRGRGQPRSGLGHAGRQPVRAAAQDLGEHRRVRRHATTPRTADRFGISSAGRAGHRGRPPHGGRPPACPVWAQEVARTARSPSVPRTLPLRLGQASADIATSAGTDSARPRRRGRSGAAAGPAGHCTRPGRARTPRAVAWVRNCIPADVDEVCAGQVQHHRCARIGEVQDLCRHRASSGTAVRSSSPRTKTQPPTGPSRTMATSSVPALKAGAQWCRRAFVDGHRGCPSALPPGL